MKNPWLRSAPKYYNTIVKELQPVSSEDRCAELKGFDLQKLRDVISWPGTQKTVRLAAERQLRKLAKTCQKKGETL